MQFALVVKTSVNVVQDKTEKVHCAIHAYLSEWKMKLNVHKVQVILSGKKRPPYSFDRVIFSAAWFDLLWPSLEAIFFTAVRKKFKCS